MESSGSYSPHLSSHNPVGKSQEMQQQQQQQYRMLNPQHNHNHHQQQQQQQQPPKPQQRQQNNQKQRQQNQQHPPIRHPSQQPVTLHLRTHPSPPVKPKHRHYDKVQQQSPQKQGRQHHPHQQQQQQQQQWQPPQHPRKLHLHLHPEDSPPLVLSSKKPAPDVCAVRIVMSQPKSHSGKQCAVQATGNKNSNGNTRKETKQVNQDTPKNNKTPKGQDNQRTSSSGSPRLSKPSKNCVGASETGYPKRFGETPDDKSDAVSKKSDKFNYHDTSDIPQTNLSVGLIVFCCFNPLFGALAIYFSLIAAKAYRDGYESKGTSRAHWSILISLFGITVTMVIVSALVVVFTLSKNSHSYHKSKIPSGIGS